jgi:8-oxo-dGTP diphosphatase
MINVAVGIIRKDGSVLLCRRKESVKYPLKWEFPGGKIENGETSADCLRRELSEELAISAIIGEEFHRQQTFYPDAGLFDVRYYWIEAFEGVPENRVFSEIRWINTTDLRHYDVLEGNREAIRKIVENRNL